MTAASWRMRTLGGMDIAVVANAMERGTALVVELKNTSYEGKTYKITPWKKMSFDDVVIETRMLTVSVKTPFWTVNITSKPIYGLVQPVLNATHTHGHWAIDQRRFDIAMEGAFPQPDAHGIVGQSYQDSVKRMGKLDTYGYRQIRNGDFSTVHGKFNSDGILPTMTTSAQAEGAIEGVYTDYKLSDMLSTDFKYSQYHKFVQSPKQELVKRAASTSEYEGQMGWFMTQRGE